MKRTCNRCRALGLSSNMTDAVCSLGYLMDDGINGPTPLEDCTKPMTKYEYQQMHEDLILIKKIKGKN